MNPGKSVPIGRPPQGLTPGLPDYPTMVHALAHAARQVPQRTALICQDKNLTYAQYGRAVAGLARRLRELGARRQRVAILMGNSIETSVAAMGGMAAGAQIALLNPGYTDHELTPLLIDCAPRILLCAKPMFDRARERAGELGIPHVLVLGAGGLELDEWIHDQSLVLGDDLPGADDLAAMFFTGGTTGLPKGAEHVHSMMTVFCRQIVSQWALDFDTERILSVAPMFHIWGHHFVNIMPLYLRATLVIVPVYKPDLVLEQFERQAITVFAGGPPAIYIGMLGSPKIETTDFSRLKYCLAGGAACPENLLTMWQEKTGCAMLEGCGMSEGAPISCNPTHGKRKLMSIGLVPPLTEMDIVDMATGTRVLGPGERGELRVKGPQFTRGYRNQPEETAIAIRDGWLYTGDVGYFDEEGYLFLVDRKKELISVGGYNVYPREIDEVLHAHPAVHEAASIGVPDDFRGEVVKACVALKPGARLGEEELIAYCAEKLIDYKVPRSVEFLAELPKTGPGKIDKLALKGQR